MHHVFVADLHYIMGAIQSVVKTFEIWATMYIHVPVTLETEIRLNIKSHRLPNLTQSYIFFIIFIIWNVYSLYSVNHYYF